MVKVIKKMRIKKKKEVINKMSQKSNKLRKNKKSKVKIKKKKRKETRKPKEYMLQEDNALRVQLTDSKKS